MNSKLKVSVNKNPTKEGIKVQFVLPETLEGDAKAQATQKLQSKLNQGLEQYNLTVSQDTDVPYSNVIGFLIPIADIKLLIKNAIGGGSAEPAPEATPAPEAAPEEPIKENKGIKIKIINKNGTSTIQNTGSTNLGEISRIIDLIKKSKNVKDVKILDEEPVKEVNRMQELAGIKSSNIELIGPDVDELLDAINFINKGIGKGNQKVQLPFGNNTLKALDDDGQSMGGGKFSIGVQPKTANESLYVRQVNDFLDDHGFTCKLYVTK